MDVPKIVTFDDYQQATGRTAVYPGERGELNAILYVALGLSGEAGEVAGAIKKVLRDESGMMSSTRRKKVLAEIGDVLWYCSQLATELDADLEEIARENVAKLFDRMNRGALRGDGDER